MGATSGAWIERYSPVSGDDDETQTEGEKQGSQKHVAFLSTFTRYRNAAMVGLGAAAVGAGSMLTRMTSATTRKWLVRSVVPGHSCIEWTTLVRHQAPNSAAWENTRSR